MLKHTAAVAAAYIYGWPAVAVAALGSLLVNALGRLIDGNLAGIEFAIPLATAAGADAYLTKPIDLEQFLQLITRLLAARCR